MVLDPGEHSCDSGYHGCGYIVAGNCTPKRCVILRPTKPRTRDMQSRDVFGLMLDARQLESVGCFPI